MSINYPCLSNPEATHDLCLLEVQLHHIIVTFQLRMSKMVGKQDHLLFPLQSLIVLFFLFFRRQEICIRKMKNIHSNQVFTFPNFYRRDYLPLIYRGTQLPVSNCNFYDKRSLYQYLWDKACLAAYWTPVSW